MTKKTISLCLSAGVILLALLGARPLEEFKGIHKHTKECRDHAGLQCLYTCKHCHGEPWQPIEFTDLENGDYEICSKCHKDTSEALDILRLPDCMRDHHQGNISYYRTDEYNKPRVRLKENPDGLQIFCDPMSPSMCKVFCITCHNPMEKPGEMMRVNDLYGEMCVRCHDI